MWYLWAFLVIYDKKNILSILFITVCFHPENLNSLGECLENKLSAVSILFFVIYQSTFTNFLEAVMLMVDDRQSKVQQDLVKISLCPMVQPIPTNLHNVYSSKRELGIIPNYILPFRSTCSTLPEYKCHRFAGICQSTDRYGGFAD